MRIFFILLIGLSVISTKANSSEQALFNEKIMNYIDKEQFDIAISILESKLIEKPKYYRAQHLLAQLYFFKKDYKMSAKHFSKVPQVERNFDYWWAVFNNLKQVSLKYGETSKNLTKKKISIKKFIQTNPVFFKEHSRKVIAFLKVHPNAQLKKSFCNKGAKSETNNFCR